MDLESSSPIVTTGAHPRRSPKYLFLPLIYDGYPIGNEQVASNAIATADAATEAVGTSMSPRRKQIFDDSEDTVGTNVNEWFVRSNERPATTINQDSGEISDPPYFLQQSSNDDTYSSKEVSVRTKRFSLHQLKGISRSRGGSSSEEYRSIIDDLTIETQKLREELKRFKRSSVTHLENEKLFEVKIHSLPASKRRELEELLRSFSTTFNNSSKDLGIKVPSGRPSRANPLSGQLSKHKSVLPGFNFRPTDSAYASMSRSGPSHGHLVGREHRAAQTRHTEYRKMQDFLQDIPERQLPRTSLEMTEKQRKKMVVTRLEQLFTGKKGPLIDGGEHSHSKQQEEVSQSAARADQASQNHLKPKEGVREANIGPHNMELDKKGLKSAQNNSKTAQSPTEQLSYAPTKSRGSPSPEQRPTRPLELDPDREQVGSDNVKYIRHLGISAPQLLMEESQDAAIDADGWVYLNLLINMAQLHIINVTPDFIRSAVTELSTKIQVSPDGKKLRWRGGTQGTRLSSDSGDSSVHLRYPLDDDDSDEGSRKRRKVHTNKITPTGQAPSKKLPKNAKSPLTTGAFFYEPIFARYPQHPSEMSYDESDSPNHYNLAGFASPDKMLDSDSPRDDGPMIFYHGTNFFSDLSGDRGRSEPPLHITGVDKDGYSSHTQDAVGCSHPQRHFLKRRTTSGSLLPFRPLNDYSEGVDMFQTPKIRRQTPSVLSDDMDFEFTTDLACDSPGSPSSLVNFSASGLGGVQPADHLLYKVHTRWKMENVHGPVRVSKSSAPRSTSNKMVHTIPKSSLVSFYNSDPQDSIISKITRMTARTKDPLSPLPPRSYEDLPAKAENISEQLIMLEPSTLPEPSSYFSIFSNSDYTGESSDRSSFTGIAHLRDKPLEREEDLLSDNDIHVSSDDNAIDVEDADDDDIDDDNSIDMFTYARGIESNIATIREENNAKQATNQSSWKARPRSR
ncbi:hypothetical protein SBOR_2812 [Sclerotinia borealis F-4128]|uniref:Frequency clock protein n=1 Tax=Sclerotinia borealis (strain F-4128) TaxID=1432307 RepID=W9CLX9_SCLBF|nr:hypothetical protein SBOR_2812 [Sclerotinia borealis F-4128]